MPTARPRHMITETDDITAALDAAARRWPESADNRAELIRRLICEHLPGEQTARMQRLVARRDRIRAGAGSVTDVWPANWRDELRAEWPE